MRKTCRYILGIALLAGALCSCDPSISDIQADRFVKFYGEGRINLAGDVALLADGGFAICGTVENEVTGQQMALWRTDRFGNVLNGFPKYYTQGDLQSGASSLVALNRGSEGFLLCGYSEQQLSVNSGLQTDIFVVRTDSRGDTLWQRTYGSTGDEMVYHAIQMIDEGFLLAGYQVNQDRSDIMLMGLTEEGDSLQLGLIYSNPHAQNAEATYLLNNGQSYLCVCNLDKREGEGTDIHVLSFDKELSPLVKNLTGESQEYGSSILEVSAEAYYVLGNRLNNYGNMELVLYFVETNGVLITNFDEAATISETNADFLGKRIIRTRDGGYAIIATRVADGNSSIFLQFMSSAMQPTGQVSFGGGGQRQGWDIDQTSDRGIILLGKDEGEGGVISLIKTSETGDL